MAAWQTRMILISLILACMLTIMPWPGNRVWLRPDFILLVLSCWIMLLPYRINIGAAFAMGIVADLLSGATLGQHALAYVLVGYVVARFHRPFFLSWPLRIATMALLLCAAKTIMFIVMLITGNRPANLYWLSLIGDIVLWPVLFAILRASARSEA